MWLERRSTFLLKPHTTHHILRLLFFLLASSLFPLASAHPANVASAQAKVQPNGTFTNRVRFDLIAFATSAAPLAADDEAMNALLDGSDEALKAALSVAEARFRAGFVSGGSIDRLAFPTVADVRRYLAADPKPRLPIMLTATVEGHLPPRTRTIAFRYPPLLDTVIQTVEFPYKEPISEPVERDQASSTLTIPTVEEVAKLAAAMNAPRKVEKPAPPKKDVAPPKKQVLPPKLASSPLKEATPAPQARAPVGSKEKPKARNPLPTLPQMGGGQIAKPSVETAAPVVVPSEAPRPKTNQVLTYLRMGYTHILPEGPDHVLFVLGLFLLGSNAKALIKQITAFTVAHSITLALATLGIVRLPGSIIEPIIAASIAFVAIENLFVKDVKPWRTLVVFLFGLVHGMGFAEVFHEAGLSGTGLITALLSFNVGVELGQLSVVAMALVAVGWFRKDPRYRQYVVVPGSAFIAVFALYWTAQRIFGF